MCLQTKIHLSLLWEQLSLFPILQRFYAPTCFSTQFTESSFSLLLKHHILHKHGIPGNSLPSYRNYAAIEISGLWNHGNIIPLNIKRQWRFWLRVCSNSPSSVSAWIYLMPSALLPVEYRELLCLLRSSAYSPSEAPYSLITLTTDPSTNMVKKVSGVITYDSLDRQYTIISVPRAQDSITSVLE